MNQAPKKPVLSRLKTWLHYLEDGILVGLLALMIGLAVAQILLRNVFDGGLVWGDSLVRMMVLWVTLVGSMVAARTRNHISIDVATRYLPAKGKKVTGVLVDLFTAVVCSYLSYYSARFVHMEYEFGSLTFAGKPAWIFQVIMPLGFGVIGLRYLVSALTGQAGEPGREQ